MLLLDIIIYASSARINSIFFVVKVWRWRPWPAVQALVSGSSLQEISVLH